jgi:hypothetical protein
MWRPAVLGDVIAERTLVFRRARQRRCACCSVVPFALHVRSEAIRGGARSCAS